MVGCCVESLPLYRAITSNKVRWYILWGVCPGMGHEEVVLCQRIPCGVGSDRPVMIIQELYLSETAWERDLPRAEEIRGIRRRTKYNMNDLQRSWKGWSGVQRGHGCSQGSLLGLRALQIALSNMRPHWKFHFNRSVMSLWMLSTSKLFHLQEGSSPWNISDKAQPTVVRDVFGDS